MTTRNTPPKRPSGLPTSSRETRLASEMAGTQESDRERRSYMEKSNRRIMLLQKAAELAENRDWSELKMSALAMQAGISRQLVYQHFPNLDALLTETAAVMFKDLWIRTQAIIDDTRLSTSESIREAAAMYLDLPAGRGDALWQIIAGINRESRELSSLSKQARDLATDMWTPRFTRELGLKKSAARALSWMLMTAFWGIRQLVRDGSLTRKQAADYFGQLVEQSVSAQGNQAARLSAATKREADPPAA